MSADPGEQLAGVRREALRGKRRLTSSVLAMEVIVFWLAIIVAIVVAHVPVGAALGVGIGLAVACIVVAGAITRPGAASWAYWAGSALQVAAIACGIAVPVMFVIGALFAALWVVALRMGDGAIRRAEQYAQQHAGQVARGSGR